MALVESPPIATLPNRWTGGRVVEGVGLLNRYRGLYLYRGFESRPVRFFALLCATRISRAIWASAVQWLKRHIELDDDRIETR